MNISIYDRGFLYGDGVFESLRTYQGKPFLIDEHLQRLLHNAKQIKIRPAYTFKKIKQAILKKLAEHKYKESYIKVILTRGENKGHGLDFSNAIGKPTLVIMIEELKELPKSAYEQGWRAIISSVKRTDIPISRIKSLCYLDNALAKEEARRAKANEAFMLDEKGHVVEGSVSNIFIVKHGVIYTPPATSPILRGITRELVLKLAKQSAMPAEEKDLTTKDLYSCDECFITMSGAGIVPITRFWERVISRGKCGPLTKKLIDHFLAETEK